MAAIRMHLAKAPPNLANDLHNEYSVVGNFPDVLMVREFGTASRFNQARGMRSAELICWVEQKKEFIHGRLEGKRSFAFGLTEPGHGSDATHSQFLIIFK